MAGLSKETAKKIRKYGQSAARVLPLPLEPLGWSSNFSIHLMWRLPKSDRDHNQRVRTSPAPLRSSTIPSCAR